LKKYRVICIEPLTFLQQERQNGELRAALEDARSSMRRLEQQCLALTTIVSQMQHQQQLQQLQMQQSSHSLSMQSDIPPPASTAAQDSLHQVSHSFH
jgi:hypothetical protein